MWRILQRGIGAVAITASAQGVLLYLASKNIHPGQWIADTIGIAVSAVIANQIFSYALLSLCALIGLFFGPTITSLGKQMLATLRLAEREKQVDRLSLVEFGKAAINHGWDILGDDSLENLDLLDAIRQAGVDGALDVFGRPVQSMRELTFVKPLIQIPNEYWANNFIGISDFLLYRQNRIEGFLDNNLDTCTSSYAADPNKTSYADIHISREQAFKWLKSEALVYRGRRERHEN